MMFKIYLAINTVFWLVMAVFARIKADVAYMENVYRVFFSFMFLASFYLLIKQL